MGRVLLSFVFFPGFECTAEHFNIYIYRGMVDVEIIVSKGVMFIEQMGPYQVYSDFQ